MKTSQYREGDFDITNVRNGRFYVWRGNDEVENFSTLRQAKDFCKQETRNNH